MVFSKMEQLHLNLALQGGGAHGAFTWGVLDRLLEDDRLVIDTISGTSAGAVNAVALASGYAENGAHGAKDRLAAVWNAISDAAPRNYADLNPFAVGMRGLEAMAGPSLARLSGAFSPYELNPLDINPLRDVLANHIDFKAFDSDGIKLAIAATDVETGMARVFENDEVNLAAVLASACLPLMSRAVEIDGRNYWDGGFSANPDLLSFARISKTQDTLIVLISPLKQEGLPKTPQEIADAVGRMTFNQPLLRDIWLVDSVRQSRGLNLRPESMLERLARQRFHLIDAGHHTARLPPGTKITPDRGLLDSLHLAGRTEADRWLQETSRHVGSRETADIADRFLGGSRSPD